MFGQREKEMMDFYKARFESMCELVDKTQKELIEVQKERDEAQKQCMQIAGTLSAAQDIARTTKDRLELLLADEKEKVGIAKWQRDGALRERDGWREDAGRGTRNQEYYRGLLVKIGDMFGDAAKSDDTGAVGEDVICCKVPELVAEHMKNGVSPYQHTHAKDSIISILEERIKELTADVESWRTDFHIADRQLEAARRALNIVDQNPTGGGTDNVCNDVCCAGVPQ